MAMSDFTPNKLSFDVDGCMNAIRKRIDSRLNVLSEALVLIVQREIWQNGNGSHIMRLDAIAQVKETKREITDDEITLEVGIDFDSLKQKEDLFVRVSVVLYGNMQASQWTWRDARVMYTKPGVETYGKNVTNKRVHVPEGYKPRALPGFAQQDVSGHISENTEKEINRYVDQFMDAVSKDVDNFDWSAFLIVG